MPSELPYSGHFFVVLDAFLQPTDVFPQAVDVREDHVFELYELVSSLSFLDGLVESPWFQVG